jgi:hypothetical protein
MISHPEIYKLVHSLRYEQSYHENSAIKADTGVVKGRKAKYVAMDERYNVVMKKYTRDLAEDTLRKLSVILDYPKK